MICAYFVNIVQLYPPTLCVSEMCSGGSRPAGGDSAPRGCREGWGGGVLDSAAESWVHYAPPEELQRPHPAGPQQAGEDIPVRQQSLGLSGRTVNMQLCEIVYALYT